jgi:hypothetical protein
MHLALREVTGLHWSVPSVELIRSGVGVALATVSAVGLEPHPTKETIRK